MKNRTFIVLPQQTLKNVTGGLNRQLVLPAPPRPLPIPITPLLPIING